MSTGKPREAVDLLQELGLKEYEAESFVTLSRAGNATAKEIAEHSAVPRTRVYDAVRVLETRGLVEVQHSSPQRFRAVSIDEAVDILEAQYDRKIDSLREALANVEPIDRDGAETTHEVWSLATSSAIEARTEQLVDAAAEEIVLVLGSERLLDDDLVDQLEGAIERGVAVYVGALTEALRDRVQSLLPEAAVFVTGLEWLHPPGDGSNMETAIGRMLLVDRSSILVSTFGAPPEDGLDERAIFGRGFTNGLVVIVRRMLATGLPAGENSPATDGG